MDLEKKSGYNLEEGNQLFLEVIMAKSFPMKTHCALWNPQNEVFLELPFNTRGMVYPLLLKY